MTIDLTDPNNPIKVDVKLNLYNSSLKLYSYTDDGIEYLMITSKGGYELLIVDISSPRNPYIIQKQKKKDEKSTDLVMTRDKYLYLVV